MNTKLCLVAPYRDRAAHLRLFVPHMRRFLAAQRICYRILVVEQVEGKPFNRAKLLNVGFHYTAAEFDYYCFHDIDMLPIVSDYSYCSKPTHLAWEVQQFGWSLPYPGYFGGVTVFDRASFRSINGFPNQYWGWGAEDDEILDRCLRHRIPAGRKKGKYRSLYHDRVIDANLYSQNIKRLTEARLKRDEQHSHADGLLTLEYRITASSMTEAYENLIVDI